MKGIDHQTVWTALCRHLSQMQQAASSLVERVTAGWRSHHHRMATDPGYVTAVSALLPAAAELITRDRRVQRVTEALAQAYIAIVRAVSQEDDWPADLAWPTT